MAESSTHMNILAIDQGTSSTKALVVSPERRVLAEAAVPINPKLVGEGGVEQDPEEVWTSVVAAGREALAQALARAGESVAAVGLANQGETVLAWNRETGEPLSPAISWQDRRAAAVCARLADRAEQLRSLTGLPLDPYFAAPKMTWLREHVTRGGICTTTDTWLLHRFTGAYVTDAATASRTLLLDLDAVDWSPEACALFAIDPESLPTIAGCAQPIGETSAFGGSLPVAGLAVDQQAALFAEACLTAGDAKCTYGTGAFLLATVGTRPRRSTSGLASCVAWKLGDEATYCLDGQVYTVGAAVNWLQQVGLVSDPADIDRLGAHVTDSNGVVFVPALAGFAAPFWRPAARRACVLAGAGGHRRSDPGRHAHRPAKEIPGENRHLPRRRPQSAAPRQPRVVARNDCRARPHRLSPGRAAGDDGRFSRRARHRARRGTDPARRREAGCGEGRARGGRDRGNVSSGGRVALPQHAALSGS